MLPFKTQNQQNDEASAYHRSVNKVTLEVKITVYCMERLITASWKTFLPEVCYQTHPQIKLSSVGLCISSIFHYGIS